MEIKEETTTKIKIEPPEIEYCEYNAEYYDDQIEIGPEFKTEPVYTEPTNWTEASDDYKLSSKELVDRHSKNKSGSKNQLTNCKKGARSYSSQSHLKVCSHVYEAKCLPKFLCNQCSYKTNIKANFSRHIQLKHSPQDPSLNNKCRKCGKNFLRRSNLLRNVKFCDLTKEFKRSLMRFSCNHCKYETGRKTTQEQPCQKCEKSFSIQSNLIQHSKICGQTKDAKRSLIHLSCDHCKYKTNKKSNLSTHIQAKHLPRDPNLNKCKKCHKSFSRRSYLLKHSKLCGQSQDFKRSLMRFNCDHCEYKTDVKTNLSEHMQANHFPRDPNLNKCSNCFKSYSQRSSLLQHLKLCGQSKDLKTSLMRFNCGHCEYKTDVKRSISDHIQAKHLPRDPNSNKCKKCDKSYSTRSHLLRHLKLCSQSEELKSSSMRLNCEHCDYKTNYKTNLLTHMQAKHLPRDPNLNKCKKCGKSYSTRSNLLKHLKLCVKTRYAGRLSLCTTSA